MLLLLGITLLMPSLVWPGYSELYSIKSFAVVAAALGLLVLMASRSSWSTEGIRSFFRTGPNLAILLFVGWMALGLINTPYRSYGVQQVQQLAGGAAIYFAVAYRLPARRNLQKLVGGLVAAVILGVVVGAIVFSSQGGGNIASAFGNSQLFAGFLVVMLPLMLVASQTDDNPVRRTAAQFATVMALIALLLTQNRSAWLGLVAGMVVLGVLAVRFAGSRNLGRNKHQVLLPGLVVLGAVAMFLVASGSGSSVLSRLTSLGSVSTDSSVAQRAQMDSAAWTMLKSSPLEGWGPGSFAYYGAHLGAPALSPMELAGRAPSLSETPHNQYGQIAAEGGLIGLGLYLMLLIGFFLRCGRSLKENASHTRRWLVIGSMAAIAAQMVSAWGSPAWQFADVSVFFWLVLGMGVAATRPRAERVVEAAAAPVARPARMPARVGWVMAQAALLAVALFVTGQAYAVKGGQEGIAGGREYDRFQECFFLGPQGGGTAIGSFQLRVVGRFRNGNRTFDQDVTSSSTFNSTNPACVRSNGGGSFTVVGAAGCSATLTASFTAAGTTCTKTVAIVSGQRIPLRGRVRGQGGGGGRDVGGGGGSGWIIGAVAGAGLLFLLLGRKKHKKGHGDDGDEGRESPVNLPPHQKITAIRATPEQMVLAPGENAAAQQVRVLVQLDNKPTWYDVTDDPDTDIRVADKAAQLVGTEGDVDQYRIARTDLARKPLTVVSSFRGLSTQTKVTFRTP